MSDIVQIAFNATVAKLRTTDKDVKNFVSELLSYTVEGVEFVASFQSGNWNGRSSFFSHATCLFPSGFVHMVNTELTRRGYRVQLASKPRPKPLGAENPIVDEFGNDDPRYAYQLESVRKIERHGRGILQVATGGGKSKIAKLIVARFRRPTLFLTTRAVLMYQMADGFKAAGFKVGIIGDGDFSPTRGVNCGMVQTLVARLKETTLKAELLAVIGECVRKGVEATDAEKKKLAKKRFEDKERVRKQTIAFLRMIEVVIGEEAHEAGGNSYFEILRHCKNATIRVALTATPFMRADAEDNMRLMAAFGPVLIKVSEKQLIDCGILARPIFRYVNAPPHPKLRKTSPWQRAVQLGYTENTAMHVELAREAMQAKRLGIPVLTLVQRQKHGEALASAYRERGLRAVFIWGEHDNAARRRALRALAKGLIDVVIGSTIVDVGVDVPAIGLLQLAGGGKAEVALRQRIGRALRAKKFGPNVAFISDWSCNLNHTLRDHTRQRRAIVEATPGFGENVLPDGANFDWSIFEKRAA